MGQISSSSLDERYKQLQQQLASEQAYSQALNTQVALGGGSLPGAPKAPSPQTISSGAADRPMPSQTEERRADPASVRICDLVPGDKLNYSSSSAFTAVVTVDPTNPALIYLHWSDQVGYDPKNKWIANPAGNTTLLSNWNPYGKGFPIFDSSNPVAVAKRVGGVDFDSVILPEDKKKEITDAISQIDNHSLIFDQWGFKDVFEKGTAISLLFYGPPGTGKTLMGQAIADKYGYKLEIISTAEIETPEPGGAERNLKEYFKKASNGKTVLLFDECDSLITDRHRVGMILAAQINALLTELERFTGIAIFTTNRLAALDPAFERRLSLKLEFPMPDKKHRVLIWKRMFPAQAPLADDIRWEDLASIEIAGGHIKNVVLKAARMAAAQKATEITDAILWEAMEKEIASMEAYHDEMAAHKQWYGTPVQGGVGAMDVIRERGKRSLGR